MFLITGAARGIGAATAELVLRGGHRAVVCDVDLGGAESLCGRLGESAQAVALDVRDPENWERALDQAWERFGGVDVLVNNAGLIRSGWLREQSLEEIEHMIDVNLLGLIKGVRAAVPRFVLQGHGHVITVGSLASFSHLKGQVVYAASKHAVRAFHHGVALESEHLPVTFSLVCPGAVDTGMLRDQVGHDSNAVSFASRALTPQQVAEAIYSAAEERPAEILLPRIQGKALRFAGVLPGVVRMISRQAERQGLRALKRLRGQG
ncbi:MAG: SDR family oxidoreductase [Planctomycetota bacterium]